MVAICQPFVDVITDGQTAEGHCNAWILSAESPVWSIVLCFDDTEHDHLDSTIVGRNMVKETVSTFCIAGMG